MIYQYENSRMPRRRGVILLVVMALLSLFAVVGISFMLYAESAATASRIYREAMVVTNDRVDEDPNLLLNWALAQFIYDVRDFGEDVYSSMRGHSLARTMYGWNYVPMSVVNFDPTKNSNTIAFNGAGPPPAIGPNAAMVNFTFFRNDGVLYDPERAGTRRGMTASMSAVTAPFSGGYNVPYTYPDRANMFLGAMKADDKGDGTGTPKVLMPSFFRPDSPFGSLNPSNPNWVSGPATLKYQVLRPRPADMYWGGPSDPHSFPLPADAGGDVKNLPGTSGFNGGNNDSVWMDLNYPVLTTRAGRKFKPLFAFLITDMDSRINLNVAGNTRGQNGVHASNQGWGPWEINIQRVFNRPGNTPEYPN